MLHGSNGSLHKEYVMIQRVSYSSAREEALKEEIIEAWAEAEARCAMEGVSHKESYDIFLEEVRALAADYRKESVTPEAIEAELIRRSYGRERFDAELAALGRVEPEFEEFEA